MLQLIDSHAHLTSEEVFPGIESTLERAKKAGISSIINICTDRSTLERGIELSEKYDWIHNAAATTPHDAEAEDPNFAFFEEMAKKGKLVAIGETGLDYHYYSSSKENQKERLEKYLKLALNHSLPLVIHCREAFQDLFKILDQSYLPAPAILHCFTGTKEEAQAVIERGLYLSLSGIVTFKKSTELKEVAKLLPLERLLIETDTPYLAPQAYRGKVNEPSYIIEIAKEIAALKGLPLEEVTKATLHNAKKVFKI